MPHPDDETDEEQARTARLLRIPADRIAYYSAETVCAWLLARNEQHRTRLRAACQELRAAAAQERCALAALYRATAQERP
jgi:hypothetical protein